VPLCLGPAWIALRTLGPAAFGALPGTSTAPLERVAEALGATAPIPLGFALRAAFRRSVSRPAERPS